VDSVYDTPVPAFRIKEWDGSPIRGTFYNEDLQKVTVSDENVFRMEKIVKRQKDKVLVRLKGWPAKYDKWVSKKDIKRLKQTS